MWGKKRLKVKMKSCCKKKDLKGLHKISSLFSRDLLSYYSNANYLLLNLNLKLFFINLKDKIISLDNILHVDFVTLNNMIFCVYLLF